jgi:hypothetical protein
MGKVASTSIQFALAAHGFNAFHSHGLSPTRQHRTLSRVLDGRMSLRLIKHDLRRHMNAVLLHAMTRWYQQHKQRDGHRLKVVTLTRDPVTRYPSGFVHRRKEANDAILAWYRAAAGSHSEHSVEATPATAAFIAELASIIAEARPSAGPEACDRCIALAGERWPEHPVVVIELRHWLAPLTWFDLEIKPVFGLDMLASSELRERGWTERSNDWVDILALKYEALSSLVPEMQRFFGLAELTLPRKNVTGKKEGAAEVATAMRAVLDTPVGQACARELRTSSYGRACGYDRLT